MSKKLEGKVALVTGASKGIGAGIALRLASEGAAVAVNYSSSKAEADRVAAKIKEGGGRAIAIRANVAKPDEAKALVVATTKEFGPIDILVNNAGVYAIGPLEAITPEQFHKHFDLNVLGLLLVTQEAVKSFNEKGGSIINVSSVLSTIAPPQGAVYVSSKAAVDAITSVLSKELGAKQIRVNAVNPGMILTEGLHAVGFDEGPWRDFFEKNTPLGRVGEVEDITGPVLFLASDDSRYVSGETIRAAGGFNG
jgi:3-oxoacyl-[acyl-carrier protein] reductase